MKYWISVTTQSRGTAKALSWSVALLDAHKDARTRLLAELDGELAGRRPGRKDLPRLPFTRAVVEEALRLDPPIWLLTRTAVDDDEVAGYAVPAGARVPSALPSFSPPAGSWARRFELP